MQEIKEVVTNEFYKKQYVAVGKEIFTTEKALQYFSEHSNQILNLIHSKNISNNYLLPVIYTPLPSMETLQNKIIQKREEIYKELNLKKATSQKEKQEQAKLLLQYLVQQLTYDMTTKEEILNVNSYEKVNFYLNLFHTNIKKLEEHHKNYLSAKEDSLKKHFKELCNKSNKILEKLHIKLEEEERKVQNKTTIESIYYSLIEHRGVCGEFSYAYSYLLDGLNIKNYVVDMSFTEKKQAMNHAINVLETIENNKKTYYAVDVTLGVNLKSDFQNAFLINPNNFEVIYPNFNILHLGKLNAFENNDRFVTNCYKGSKLVDHLEKHFKKNLQNERE